jgi:DNA (cytosine-5)-methyltransferase 1
MNDGQDVEKYQSRRRRLQEKHRNGNGAGLVLSMASAMWQTPTVLDSGGRDYVYPSGDKTKPFSTLVGQAQGTKFEAAMWATPTVQDSANTAGPSRFDRSSHPLNVQAVSLGPLVPATPSAGAPTSPTTRRLNPRFVEALMGWPIGFSDCDSSETESSLTAPPSPGVSSGAA